MTFLVGWRGIFLGILLISIGVLKSLTFSYGSVIHIEWGFPAFGLLFIIFGIVSKRNGTSQEEVANSDARHLAVLAVAYLRHNQTKDVGFGDEEAADFFNKISENLTMRPVTAKEVMKLKRISQRRSFGTLKVINSFYSRGVSREFGKEIKRVLEPLVEQLGHENVGDAWVRLSQKL